MKQNFDKALALTLKYEGGYSDDPYDPGGATREGVTQTTYNVYRRGKGLPRRSVRLMEDEERDDIYHAKYWEEVDADRLPSGVDALAFDIAVNSGPARARRFLAECEGLGLKARIDWLDHARRSFWRSLETYWRFGKGWNTRENDLYQHALALAQREVDVA
jgi:lysozyme family protein